MGNVEVIKIESLDQYQISTLNTWGGPNRKEHALLGVVGEAGEIAEARKKFIRGDFNEAEYRSRLIKEMGDCLYYLAVLAQENGMLLSEIATENIRKLQDRKERGVICGDGDAR